MTDATAFTGAATAFVDLVGRIPPTRWSEPGLGEWSIRELIGHTARAITTVETYLSAPPATELTVPDAVAYYTEALEKYTDNAAIAARGHAAGTALADDPEAVTAALLEDTARISAIAAATPPDRLVAIGPLGIRFDEYLRTRIFELVVHSLDLAAATELELRAPASVVSDTAALAARVAAAGGHGPELLFALTGRGELPGQFSIFPS